MQNPSKFVYYQHSKCLIQNSAYLKVVAKLLTRTVLNRKVLISLRHFKFFKIVAAYGGFAKLWSVGSADALCMTR